MLVSCNAWRSKVFLFASVLLGLAQASSAAECNSSVGGRSVSNSVPLCALGCIQDFIRNQLPNDACCDGTDFACLCRTNSTSGLTLGEAALACTVGSCSPLINSVNDTDVYGMCDGISSALPATHTAITATQMATVTDTAVVTTSPSTSTTKATSMATSTSSLPTTSSSSRSAISTVISVTSMTTSPIVTSSPTTMTTSSTSTAETSATASSHPAASLSSPAVIGVSVASGVSALFLFGAAVFFCGRRMRRKRRNEEDRLIFEIGGEMSEPPDVTAAAVRGSMYPPPLQPRPRDDPNRGVSNGPNFHQFPSQPVARQGPLVVLTPPGQKQNFNQTDLSPETTSYGGSPESQSSQHTLSRLLPERKLIDKMSPEPLRTIRQPPPVRPVSEATVFDEEEQSPNSPLGPPLVKSQIADVLSAPNSRPMDHGGLVPVIELPADPRSTTGSGVQQQGQIPYRHPAYSSYKWEKDAAPLPTASRNQSRNENRPVIGNALPPSELFGLSPTQQYSNGNSNSNGYGNGNSTTNPALQRNFSRLGSGPRSLTTPTRTTAPYSFGTTEPAAVATADSSYETILAEDDWAAAAERSKLSLPAPQQQQQHLTPVPQKRPAPAAAVEDKLPLPPKSPLRYQYPAVPRSVVPAIMPAVQVPRRSQAAELYYENRRIAGLSQIRDREQNQQRRNGDNNTNNYMTGAPELPGAKTTAQNVNASFLRDSSYRSRSNSPSRLLAKRRGETVADKIESQFRSGVQSKATPGSSAQGKWKIVDESHKKEPTSAPENPFEPKLPRTPQTQETQSRGHNITPTRQGEDLYLRVD